MKPTEVFDGFSPYLRAKVDEKKKTPDPAWAKRTAIIVAIASASIGPYSLDDRNKMYEDGTWDPRWLDVAVEIGNVELTCCLARSTHKACKTFLSKLLSESPLGSTPMIPNNLEPAGILKAMIRIEHPDAIPSLMKLIKRFDSDKQGFQLYWIWFLIRELPKSAVTPLEALLPTLSEKTADQLLRCISELKNKP
jgi:hypothetical protein